MKIPCLTIRIDGDDLVVLYAGTDKAKALETAKAEVNKPDVIPGEYRVVQAIGAGIAWRRKVTKPAPLVEVVTPSEQGDDEADDSDELTKRVRADLKAKGVKVPPRISVEKLLDLAVEHGVEV